MNRTTTRFFTF